jgi:4-hydroxybenzoate polyprenyltransferase
MIRTWLRALRVPHSAKNTLVFVGPVLGAHIWTPNVFWHTTLLFVVFCALSSATYIINDIVDVAADRQHPIKRSRPIAAGQISEGRGLIVAAVLASAAIAGSLALPWTATAALVVYAASTLAYSFVLKKKAIYDVVALSGLFTLRIVAGCLPLPGLISPWLLTFSMLFFLGLAMIKRYAELSRVVRTGGVSVGSRGYSSADLPLLLASGVASGFGAILVFTSYLIHEQYPRQVYSHPQALWALIPVLLVWVLRAWHYTVHGRMNEDPVLFALKDRISLAMGAVVAATLAVAWGGA